MVLVDYSSEGFLMQQQYFNTPPPLSSGFFYYILHLLTKKGGTPIYIPSSEGTCRSVLVNNRMSDITEPFSLERTISQCFLYS